MTSPQLVVFDGSKSSKHDLSSPYAEIQLVVDGVVYRITPHNGSISVDTVHGDYPGLSIHPTGSRGVLIKAEESTSRVVRKKARKLEQERETGK